MGIGKDIGMAGASAGIGMGMGVLGNLIGGNSQRKRNKEMMADQLEAQKKAMDYQNEKQLAMWKDTNAPAQRQQYEKAGLNVGLMYGGSGAGGATVGGGMGSVTGATASDNSANITAGTAQAMQLALMNAQKENIEADTANKEAEAGYTGGAKTANTEADTAGKKLQNQWENFLQGKDEQGASLKETAFRVDVNKTRSEISRIDEEIKAIPIRLQQDATRIKQDAQRIVIEAQNARTNEERNRITEDIARLERGLKMTMQGNEMWQREMHQGDQKGQHNDRMEQQTADRYMRAIEGLFSTAIPWYQRGEGTTTYREGYSDKKGGYNETTTTKRN